MFHEDDEDFRKSEEFLADLRNRNFGKILRGLRPILGVAAFAGTLAAIFLLGVQGLAGP